MPVEYAGRYRDALGVPLPCGLPESLLEPAANAAQDLARRYARTHGPFTSLEFAARYALGRSTAEALLRELASAGRLLEGEFRPGGAGREWCDPDVLQSIRRRSLAKLRQQVEPVDPPVLVRLLTSWQGVIRRRAGLDALLDAIENLQGAPMAASIFESEILAARVERYNPADLDALTAAGEVVWCGVEPLGDRDGRLALYLSDHVGRLRRPVALTELSPKETAILDHLRDQGASFFARAARSGWRRIPGGVPSTRSGGWSGGARSPTTRSTRCARSPGRTERRARKPATGRAFRSRRRGAAIRRRPMVAASATASAQTVSPTEWSTATAQQLLSRYGVLTREVAAAEGIFGGFGAVYDVLKALEDAGRIRRGYFVGGVGATQFALPAALDLLRSLTTMPDDPEVVSLAATDPANPYGTILKWPAPPATAKPADAVRHARSARSS